MSIDKIRFWCHKVIPLVYDDSLSYYELLCKVVSKVNEIIENYNPDTDAVFNIIKEIMDEWKEDGTLEEIINETIFDELDDRIEALETDDTSMKQDLNGIINPMWKGKRIVFFGDSWVVGSVTANHTTDGFAYRIANIFDMNISNYGVGGAGFCRTNNTVDTQISTASSELTAKQKSDTKCVVLFGGINDWRHRTTDGTGPTEFASAIISAVQRCQSIFPNAVIVVGIINTASKILTHTQINWIYTARYRLQALNSYRIMILDNICNVISGNSSWFASDSDPDEGGLHPNEAGHARLAGYIANCMIGGNPNIMRYCGTPELEDGVSCDYPFHLFRNNFNIEFDCAHWTFSTPITELTRIGVFDRNYAPKSQTSVIFTSGNRLVGALLITYSGSVYLSPNDGESISGGWSSAGMYMYGKNNADRF